MASILTTACWTVPFRRIDTSIKRVDYRIIVGIAKATVELHLFAALHSSLALVKGVVAEGGTARNASICGVTNLH